MNDTPIPANVMRDAISVLRIVLSPSRLPGHFMLTFDGQTEVIARALMAEREWCAKKLDEIYVNTDDENVMFLIGQVAAAIRNGG